MKIYKCFLAFGLGLMFAHSASAQEGFNAVIQGIVVDEKGSAPFRAFSVTFDVSGKAKEKNCGAKEYEIRTDGAGKFLLQEHCELEDRTILLFTESAIDLSNAQFPISAPFWHELRRNDPRFAGRSVQLMGNQQIDLGKIPVQIWYNRVELFVTDNLGRPFYKNENDWADFVLIVRDPRGDAVGSKALSTFDRKNSVRVDRGSVNLALPEGTWTLELLRDWSDFDSKGMTLRNLGKTTITVNKTDVCLRARIVVK